MKKINGIARIYMVLAVTAIIIIGALIIAFYLKKAEPTIKNEEKNVVEQEENIEETKNIIKNETETDVKKAEPLVFDEKLLREGKTFGNVEFYNSYTDNVLVLSITGKAENSIEERNFVSTKNRWYHTIDLTDYTTLEFYARNGGTGDVMICIDDTIVKRIRYTNVPTIWTKYKVDVSKYKGKHIIAIAGGYADNTGSDSSNTQYRSIKLK